MCKKDIYNNRNSAGDNYNANKTSQRRALLTFPHPHNSQTTTNKEKGGNKNEKQEKRGETGWYIHNGEKDIRRKEKEKTKI